ncbi:Piso0_002046 [Millerozyma farinosa CBS 7064]|uniref:Piso0_002046 protein n=1 Tax=Pichia sorbitophila (strain ATCC MYA-4447 / BCRC 22081 / CBS 7064 / NBRC 10061 / NRRL Y-12695) TaxID=559304 RepID=G8YBJ5_PICSO|nr:Piso0_002046 [Millerozyma farinosa CBS 7064]
MSEEKAISGKEPVDVKVSAVTEDGLLNEAVIRDKEIIEDVELEKRVLFKMDAYLVSLLSLAYFLASLDKSNIGNAKLAGLTEDLNLVGNQYGNAVSVMYATYVPLEPVYANLLGVFGPKVVLSFCLTGWSIVSICTSQCRNYYDLIACRILLGAFESGLYPCVNMVLTSMLRRSQFAKRFSYVMAASASASAFGGLISYGCITMDGKGGWKGWKWMYVIEGSISLFFLPMYLLFMPNRVENFYFFDSEEKDYMKRRYHTMSTYKENDKISWKDISSALKDFRTWLTGAIQFCLNLTSYGLGTFMPIIVQGLGFTNVRAQLLMIPIYFVTAVSYLILARISDKYCLRWPFGVAGCLVSAVGLAIVVGATQMGVRFFGLFIVAIPLYLNINGIWISGNTNNFYKRATVFGFNQLIGNSSGVVYGQMFSTADSPRYIKGLCVCLATQVAAGFGFLSLFFYYRWENARRERLIAEAIANGTPLPDMPEKGDKNVYFKYSY